MPNSSQQPADAKASKPKPPIDKQLDALLVQIEEVEPGTIDAVALPDSFQAIQSKPEASDWAPAAEATSDTMLNAPPADTAPTQSPAQAQTTEPQPDAPAPNPEQADMLAALNSALQGLSNDTSAEPAAQPATESPAPAEAMSMEDKLQQEIAALMDAGPQVAETPATDAMPATPQADGPSTEDQIAMEIEGLLNPDASASAAATQASPETAIDELDKMLAREIDADDELAGDFQSVEELTAGIKIDNSTSQPAADDEHAATAREVAAELDTQPEDLFAPPPAQKTTAGKAAEDPFAVLSEIAETAEKNEVEHQRRIAIQTPDWQHWLAISKERLLNTCFLLNWPARRFLTAEWRANLGYIALLNLFFGVGLWIVLILF